MKRKTLIVALCCLVSAIALTAAAVAVTQATNKKKAMTEIAANLDKGDALVELQTSEGDILVRLYGDTPLHRDNFLKLVNEHYYDGVLFHRVIKDFMVQTGDPESRDAKPGKRLGAGGPGYTIAAEIVYPSHFHKRGALAAARQGDSTNPERRSSGSQFYIVTGKTYNDSTLNMMEQRMAQGHMKEIFDKLARENRDKIMELRRNRDQAGLQALQDSLIAQTEKLAKETPAPTLTPEQREAYTTVGGTPHLDNTYTVFGEVVSGMDVIDKIEKAETDAADRPVTDIKIISAKVVKP